jgi:hypothetical protein
MASLHPGELLIDLGEDKAARAVVFGLLDELERRKPAPGGEVLPWPIRKSGMPPMRIASAARS